MQMVRSGCAALRTVINDEAIRQSFRELEHCADRSGDTLRTMVGMNNREMPVEYRKRIAVDREFRVEWNPLLTGRKICCAQETRTPGDRGRVDGGRRADDAMRNV